MYKFGGVSALAMIAISAPAYAGEEVRYEAAPDWVIAADLDADTFASGPSEILYDWQHRLEAGMVHEYNDRAVRIDNPDSLMSEGTLQYSWAPDKGDLFIHRFEILRGGKVIDLAAKGVRFEILRREQGLESRSLDGRLTATVAVPGLQEGDILRVAHSITLADQALGDEVQAFQYLPPAPWRVGQGRTILSWPTDSDISYQAGPNIDLPDVVERGGYNYLTVDLPIAKPAEMPEDAPSRFSRPPLLRAGSFASWQELSAVMEPHFTKAAIVAPDSAVATEVAAIMGQSDDPLKRTELAVRLVQEQVSYLLDGLDGGNYLPQSAEDTWEKRYGDCKAKSVLLLSILRQMGIDSDVVLVTTEGGDALPDLLPIPGNFDHMIVRATIDGVDYWIDGTSIATRMHNLAEVPAFYYALPLQAGGADLTKMTERQQPFPDSVTRMTFDQSAGVDLPILFSIEMEISGTTGASIQTVVDEDDPEVRKQIGRRFANTDGAGQVTSVLLSYDEEKAIGNILIKGVSDSAFDFDQGDITMDMGDTNEEVSFTPNRIRPKWRDIPVATYGPRRDHTITTILLPDGGEGFTLTGTQEIDDRFANTQIIRKSSLSGDRVTVEEQTISDLGEIAIADLAENRRAALRISKADLTLNAPENTTWRWELDAEELAARTRPARNAYNVAVVLADDDDFAPLQSRANFYRLIYDFDNALKDINAVIAEEPTANLFLTRSNLYVSLGQLDAAIADIQTAYDLSPSNDTAYYQAQLIARTGDTDSALELLELLPVSEDERDGFIDTQSFILGMAGDVDTGLTMLEERLVEKSESSTLLNADCWYRGIHKVGLSDAVAQCTRAVERADYPASVLDSRAMVHFAKGDFDAALADLDAALKIAPGLSASRYLRGIILLEQGNKDGRRQIESALRQSPELKDYYALFGITPKL